MIQYYAKHCLRSLLSGGTRLTIEVNPRVTSMISVGKQVYVRMKIPTYNGSEKSARTDSKASNQVNQGKVEKGQQEAHFYN